MGSSFKEKQERINRTRAKLQKMEAEHKQSARNRETRRLIFLGRVTELWMEWGRIDRAEFMRSMDKFLTRNYDRELFDLPEIEEAPKATTTNASPAAKDQPPSVPMTADGGSLAQSTWSQRQPAAKDSRPIHVRTNPAPAQQPAAQPLASNGRKLAEVGVSPDEFFLQ